MVLLDGSTALLGADFLQIPGKSAATSDETTQ